VKLEGLYWNAEQNNFKSIFRFVMCLEAHYICMVKHGFEHNALVPFNI